MAYSVSNPPSLLAQCIGGSRKVWLYVSTDTATAVRVAGYISNAYQLGMRAGDIVLMIDSDASPIAASWMIVTSCTLAAGADLSNGVAITETNSD